MDLQSLKSNPGDAQNYLSCATNERKINQQVKSQPTSRANHTVQGYTLCTTSKGNPEKKYIIDNKKITMVIYKVTFPKSRQNTNN